MRRRIYPPLIVTEGWLEELKLLTEALADLENKHVALQNDDSAVAARETLASSSKAIVDARALIARATQAELAILGAGHALSDAVRSITDFVYSQLPSTQPDLDTLKTLSGGLGDVAAGLAGSVWPGPEPCGRSRKKPCAGPRGSAPPGSISDARTRIAAAQSEVARRSVPVLVKIQSMVDIAEQTTKVANCTPRGIDPEAADHPVRGDADHRRRQVHHAGSARRRRHSALSRAGSDTDSIAVSVASQAPGLLVLNITGKVTK